MKKVAVVAIALLALVGCTDQQGAYKALQDAGYTEISIKGYAAFSCSRDDSFATSFLAKGPTGRSVTGAVCSGVFKGKTIRLN